MIEFGTKNIGEPLSWTSQAGGKSKEKSGIIIATLYQGEYLDKETVATHLGMDARELRQKYSLQFDGSTLPLKRLRYIVEVATASGKSKPKLYAPRI